VQEVLQALLIGLGTGAVYGLLAQGVVMIYRGSGVLNLAHGAFAMISAYVFNELVTAHGWSTVAAALASIVLAGVLGFLTELLVMRPLRGRGTRTPTILLAGASILVLILRGVGVPLTVALLVVVLLIVAVVGGISLRKHGVPRILHGSRHAEASPLVRVIATLGIVVILVAVATLRYSTATTGLTPSVFPTRATRLIGVDIGINQIFNFAICVGISILLYVAYRYTRIGLATSAVAENERSASALGWSPGLVASVNWTVGAVLAGLAGVLIAPITGLDINALTLLVIPALAAVLIGNFRSFPITLLGALLLGAVEQIIETPPSAISHVPVIRSIVNLQGSFEAIPFLVVVVILVARGRSRPGRGQYSDRLPSIGTGKIDLRVVVPLFLIGGVLMLVVVPTTWSAPLALTFIAAIVMLSVVVLTGYAGQISLAQFAIAGLGAVTASRLVYSQSWPFPIALVVGVLAAAAVGVIFALPALRTRGINLAVITLGLGLALQYTVFTNSTFTGPAQGMSAPNQTVFGWNIDPIVHANRFVFLTFVALVVASLVVANLRRSRSGRQLIALRGNERAAAALGISVVKSKVFAFGVSAGLAGLGGILLAFSSQTLQFGQGFDPLSSILVLAFVTIGGVGYLAGPIFGALLWDGGVGTLIGDQFSSLSQYIKIIGGIVLILLLMQDFNGAAHFNLAIGQRLVRVIHFMIPFRVGRRDVKPTATEAHRAPPGVLSVEGLTVRYGNVIAISELSLKVEPGQVVGLIGPNGAGKTTVLDAISGFADISAGAVRYNGADITGIPDYRRALLGISRSFQSLELFEDMTVLENLRTACEAHDKASRLIDLLGARERAMSRTAAMAVREFSLQSDLHLRPAQLSYGRRRLVAIARALAAGSSIVLLDEPAAGLDSAESAELGALVRKLADEWRIGVLLIEHDMTFVMSVCNHIHVVDFGRPIAEGAPAEVQRNPNVIAAYLGVPPEDAPSRPTSPGSSAAAVRESAP
jgi:ABC-type branched-subunit amino acid transport system ATPase component/branched-subunit amino acid ABC-type transport system permease component